MWGSSLKFYKRLRVFSDPVRPKKAKKQKISDVMKIALQKKNDANNACLELRKDLKH